MRRPRPTRPLADPATIPWLEVRCGWCLAGPGQRCHRPQYVRTQRPRACPPHVARLVAGQTWAHWHTGLPRRTIGA